MASGPVTPCQAGAGIGPCQPDATLSSWRHQHQCPPSGRSGARGGSDGDTAGVLPGRLPGFRHPGGCPPLPACPGLAAAGRRASQAS